MTPFEEITTLEDKERYMYAIKIIVISNIAILAASIMGAMSASGFPQWLTPLLVVIFGIFVPLYFIQVYVERPLPVESLLWRPIGRITIVNGLKLGLLMYALNRILSRTYEYVSRLPINDGTNQSEIIRMFEAYAPYVIVSSLIIAPIFEELIFRDAIQRFVFPSYEWLGILASCTFFSLVHMPDNVAMFITYALLALPLAWVYRKTGNLQLVIIAHSVNNFLSLLPLIVRALS